jgi:hypothetical protein
VPGLREILQAVARSAEAAGCPLPTEVLARAEVMVRSAWPSQRIYIPPAEGGRDVQRTEQIRTAAQRLPARVVAERFGVSERWVRRLRQ